MGLSLHPATTLEREDARSLAITHANPRSIEQVFVQRILHPF
jgi:hypothetical protein